MSLSWESDCYFAERLSTDHPERYDCSGRHWVFDVSIASSAGWSRSRSSGSSNHSSSARTA